MTSFAPESGLDSPQELPIDEEIYDVTIVGGGPVGLFGAFYAGIRQMKTKIIDSLPELGGQLTALYPEKYVYDMPGYYKILARDLASEMVKQGLRFSPSVPFLRMRSAITSWSEPKALVAISSCSSSQYW